MTPGGWINMMLSVGFVTVLFVYCVWRVLTGKRMLTSVSPHTATMSNRGTQILADFFNILRLSVKTEGILTFRRLMVKPLQKSIIIA